MTKYLGDIVIVEHLHIPQSSFICIPETARANGIYGIPAKVIGIGKKAGALPIKTGDTVIVPEHLGSRNRIPDNPNAIIYDSVDVLATLISD